MPRIRSEQQLQLVVYIPRLRLTLTATTPLPLLSLTLVVHLSYNVPAPPVFWYFLYWLDNTGPDWWSPCADRYGVQHYAFFD